MSSSQPPVPAKRKRTEEVEAEGGDGGLSNTVYLEGIPFTAVEDDIVTFCSQAGPVRSVRAAKWQDTGRLRGYAHVEFASPKDAKKALALSGQNIGTRYITVSMAKPLGAGEAATLAASAAAAKPRPKGCTTLFVRGLPYEASEEDVRAVFEAFGAVTSVRIARNPSTRISKGFGYVQFEHGFVGEAVMKAFGEAAGGGGGGKGAVPPLTVLDRRVTGLDWDVGAPKASFRTSDGQFYAKTEEGQVAGKALAAHGGGKKAGGAGGSSRRDLGARGGAEDDGGDVSALPLRTGKAGKEKGRGKAAERTTRHAEQGGSEEEGEGEGERGREANPFKKAKYARRKEKERAGKGARGDGDGDGGVAPEDDEEVDSD